MDNFSLSNASPLILFSYWERKEYISVTEGIWVVGGGVGDGKCRFFGSWQIVEQEREGQQWKYRFIESE